MNIEFRMNVTTYTWGEDRVVYGYTGEITLHWTSNSILGQEIWSTKMLDRRAEAENEVRAKMAEIGSATLDFRKRKIDTHESWHERSLA